MRGGASTPVGPRVHALSLADRVQIVAAGKVVAAGTPDEVLRSGTAREVYLGGMIGPAAPATPA